MKYFLFFFLSLYLYSTPFKVATYNVENLFDAKYQGSEYKEYIPGKHNWNQRMVEIKLNHIAEVICDINADILGLQEIENKIIFKQLISRLNQVGCAYKYSAITDKKNAPIQVALLSRYAIIKQTELQVSYSPRVRNILEVVLKIEDKPLTLFVNHWKSKSYKGYESKRIKYAKVLQKRIESLAASKEYIILGDLNSDYDVSLTLPKNLNDSHGDTAFNDILNTKTDEKNIQKAKKGVHYSLWYELPIENRWSHKYYGKKSTLDHIVLPQSMFDAKGIDYVDNSFNVFRAKYLFTKRGYINAWRYKNGKHRAKGYSDHLPIYAYFDLKPYISQKKHKVRKIKNKSIDYLYSIEKLIYDIKLDDCVVVFKRGSNAVIKQDISGRGIYLYGCARRLKEGYKYDLLVKRIKSYKGLKEITHMYSLKDKGSVKYQKYYKNLLDTKSRVQNEVIRDITGIYKNHLLYIKGQKIPIYFKKRKSTLKDGIKIKIDYAHIGYYNRLQLVVHNPKDFTILE